jgi:1,4-dihydroxy-2-naphthoate octaprenyltransferase
LASAAASLAYSSNPFPLGDHGLGDPLFFVFFGPVSVVASYYVQAAATLAEAWPLAPPAGTVTAPALAAGLAVGALTTNILLVDNIRDLDYDRSKGEHTLAVIIGAGWTRVEYAALLAFAYLVPLWFWLGAGFGPSALLPWLALPYGLLVARRVWRGRTHEALIPMIQRRRPPQSPLRTRAPEPRFGSRVRPPGAVAGRRRASCGWWG